MSISSNVLAFASAALIVATCMSAGHAQRAARATALRAAVVKACGADVKAQCAGVQPGKGRIRACVKEHFKDLSEPCQTVLLKATAVGKACAADIKQNCAGTRPGGGRIRACMKERLADVSEPCKEVLARATAGRT
jgi:hypothetical protein